MTVKLKSLKTDIKAEREGDWVTCPQIPGTRFKVKHLESPSFKEARELLMRKLAARNRGKPIPSDDMTREMGQLVAKEILLGWDGMDEEYSAELAEDVMTDPAYRKIHDAVNYCANLVGEGQIEFIESGVKNS